jgi:hypothetical protein
MTQQAAASPSIEYCLARGEESERMAAEAVDEKNKAIFQESANRWRRLARDTDVEPLVRSRSC